MKKPAAVAKPVSYTFKEKIAKKLTIGDQLQSKTGRVLTVSLVVPKERRVIILFDGDMEIDFDPYQRLLIIDGKIDNKV